MQSTQSYALMQVYLLKSLRCCFDGNLDGRLAGSKRWLVVLHVVGSVDVDALVCQECAGREAQVIPGRNECLGKTDAWQKQRKGRTCHTASADLEIYLI